MRVLFTIALLVSLCPVWGQITITAADMPVSGDMLRYSIASPVGSSISLSDTGASVTWNYALVPIRQAVDTFKLAAAVNFLYAITVGATASGYKVADSFPGIPLPIKQLYTFFETKSGPGRYQAKAFAANISGIPTAANYSKPDVWYYLPLNFGNNDSADYSLNFSLASVGGIKQEGYRKTRVDGWGTITTPFYTAPTNCIRVRSEIHEIDSISFGTTTFGLPRNSVEYKWLVNGAHYPALWVTTSIFGGTETISNIRYQDSVRDLNPPLPVAAGQLTTNAIKTVNVFPNPSAQGIFTVDVPAEWTTFTVEVYNSLSENVANYINQRCLDLGTMPHGIYLVRIMSGDKTAIARLER